MSGPRRADSAAPPVNEKARLDFEAGLRRTLSEPEPMDAAGSPELAELYAAQRRKRVLGLFWGSGVVLPLCIGSVSVLQAWFPQNGSAWGLI
ncbi:MAG: hypothetical protein FJ167_04500, partial [Gammaproteobacteria bacterium]|nr:hypothetical protein [Gammaproteobacteria bacterium]